jgi:hypothetical protein
LFDDEVLMKKERDDGMVEEEVQREVEMVKWWLFCYLRSKQRSSESGCRMDIQSKPKTNVVKD